MKTYLPNRFIVERDEDRCISCQVCVRQCGFDVHHYDAEDDSVYADDEKCVACHRCVTFCPTQALNIRKSPLSYRENSNWRGEVVEDIIKQAETGGILLTGMGSDKPFPIYWDKLVLNASQVTNPSIDPLREPMELRTYLGASPTASTCPSARATAGRAAPRRWRWTYRSCSRPSPTAPSASTCTSRSPAPPRRWALCSTPARAACTAASTSTATTPSSR
jgi:NAD-dependent dihydropyrimidine dehydrogenase PreA subunit